MPSATASGADAGGSAKHREHNQGNQERKCTVEQKAAVLRIRRCQPTAFYDILGIETVKTTCSEADIKKAYRKQSLLTHPDKNGHEHADEAFKMVSRAFGVLGDKEKREKFDRYGTDPDSRFESARAQAGNPFSGFGGRAASGGGGGSGPGFGGGNMWEEEMSPEEMFQRFFGGGFGGPFGGESFTTGRQQAAGDMQLHYDVKRLTKRRMQQASTRDRSLSSTLAGIEASVYIKWAAASLAGGRAKRQPARSGRRRAGTRWCRCCPSSSCSCSRC